MTTSADILTLAQWLSPAYPVGAFAYSHGLEQAIGSGVVSNGSALQSWLEDVLEHGGGRGDCVLLRMAYASQDQDALQAVNDAAFAFAASAERRLETRLQGDAFCKTTGAIWGCDMHDLAYPVAVGHAAAKLSIDCNLTAALYAQAMAGNLVAVAQRLMALGQTDAQAIVAALAPICETIASETADATLDDLQSTAFLSDIAAMHHETLQPRIFRS